MIKRTFILLILLSSCGLKVVNELNDNLLFGKWSFEKLNCYNQNDFLLPREEYLISNIDAPTLDFKNSKFSYSVSTSQPCISSAYGRYLAEFDGSRNGELKMAELNTSVACNLSLIDIRGSAGTISIPISLVTLYAKELNWVRNGDTLELQIFNSFKGSSSSSCLSECECRMQLTKI